MGNSVRKTRMVRVLPDPNAELLPMDSRVLEELGRGRAKRYFRPKYRDIINTMRILTALIGNFNSPYRKLGRAGLLLWLLSMSINFMYDGYESRVKYGYPWMSVRGLLWITCCLGTWFTIRRTMPWFEQNLCKLENDKLYRRVLQDMSGTTEVRDWRLGCLDNFSVCRVLQRGKVWRHVTVVAKFLDCNKRFRLGKEQHKNFLFLFLCLDSVLSDSTWSLNL